LQQIWLILVLFLLVAGILCADGITGCALNGASMNNNLCYSANTLFTTPLTLDWETAFGQATINSNPQNPHTVTPLAPWTTNIAGVNVGVNVGADYSVNGVLSANATLTRVDNEVYVWNPVASQWVPPAASNDPTLVDDFTYGGHFSAPGPAKVAGDGAHLLTMETNGQVFATGSYVITFDQGIHAAGLLLSVQGGSNNINFDATIKAYGIEDPTTHISPLLATYVINTSGLGGLCGSLSDTINDNGVKQPNPTGCAT